MNQPQYVTFLLKKGNHVDFHTERNYVSGFSGESPAVRETAEGDGEGEGEGADRLEEREERTCTYSVSNGKRTLWYCGCLYSSCTTI